MILDCQLCFWKPSLLRLLYDVVKDDMGICAQSQSKSWLEIFWAHSKLSSSPLETSQFQRAPSHLIRSPSNSLSRSLPSQPQVHTPPCPAALSKPHQLLNSPNSFHSRCAPSLSLKPTPTFTHLVSHTHPSNCSILHYSILNPCHPFHPNFPPYFKSLPNQTIQYWILNCSKPSCQDQPQTSNT